MHEHSSQVILKVNQSGNSTNYSEETYSVLLEIWGIEQRARLGFQIRDLFVNSY